MTNYSSFSKGLFVLLFALICPTLGYAQLFKKKFKLPDAKVTAQQLCGAKCRPGNVGIVMPLYVKTYDPQVDNNTTEASVAHSIVGRTYAANDFSGSNAWRCSATSTNPFVYTDIVRLATNEGTTFNYWRREKLNLDVTATVQTNLDEIKLANPGIDVGKLTSFGAKLTAAYSKFAGKELLIIGRYSQWGLSDNALEHLVKNTGYSECKKFLIDNDYKIITAVGMVYFDITYGENSLDKIASALQAEAAQSGIVGNISVSFKREVSKDLKKITKGYYQVVVWRTARGSELKIGV